MSLFKPRTIAAIALLALGMQSGATAQVGANRISLPAGSDSAVAVNWTKDADFQGVAVGNDGTNTVLLSGTPLTDGKYDNGMYYVRFTTGAAAGRWSTITMNETGQFTLADSSFIADIVDGTEFTIYPHMKLSDVLPAGLLGVSFVEPDVDTSGFVASVEVDRTQVLTFDPAATGVDKGPSDRYFFYDGHWRSTAGGPEGASQDDAILLPDQYLLVRNQNHPDDLMFVPYGNAPTEVRSILVNNEQDNDILVSSQRPTAVALRDLGLGGTDAFDDAIVDDSGFVPTFEDGDTLRVFTNNGSGIDIGPATVYFYYDGAWRSTAAGPDGPAQDDAMIPAGSGVILRKSGIGAGTAVWRNRARF